MKKYKLLATIAFCIYIAALILIIPFSGEYGLGGHEMCRTRIINLIPFRYTYSLDEVLVSIVFFLPLGLFLRIKNKGRLFINTAIIFGSAIILELIKYVTAFDICDITDVITHTAGGLLGYGLTSLMYVLFRDEDKTTRWLTIVSSVAIFCVVAFVGFFEICILIAHIA